MSFIAIIFLLFSSAILFVIISVIFRQHGRVILWSGAIAFFLALCFLFATGIFKPEVDDTKHNAAILAISVLMFGICYVFVVAAEEPHKLFSKKHLNRLSKKESTIDALPSEDDTIEDNKDAGMRGTDVLITEENNLKGVIIPRSINTALARKVFSKAVDAGYITVDGTRLIWNDSTVLLAYMCGRIYCRDRAEKLPNENKYCWEKGKDGFPNAELTRLFQREGIGQARLNRNSSTVPKKSEEVDIFFERS